MQRMKNAFCQSGIDYNHPEDKYREILKRFNVNLIDFRLPTDYRKLSNMLADHMNLVSRKKAEPVHTYVYFGDLVCAQLLDCVNLENSVIKIGFGPKNYALENDNLLAPCASNWVLEEQYPYQETMKRNKNFMELFLYCHTNKIQIKMYSPHFVSLKGGFVVENFAKLRFSDNTRLLPYIETAAREIDKLDSYDTTKAVIVVTDKIDGITLHQTLTNNNTTDEELVSILFQIVYNLVVMNYYGIQHNDLHTDNVFVEDLGVIHYHSYRITKDRVYTVPVRYMVSFYDWDLGTLFSTPFNEEEEDFINSDLPGKLCKSYGICNEKLDKFDLFLVLSFLNASIPYVKNKLVLEEFIRVSVNDPSLLTTEMGYKFRWCNVVSPGVCDGPYTEKDDNKVNTPLHILTNFVLFEPYLTDTLGKPKYEYDISEMVEA